MMNKCFLSQLFMHTFENVHIDLGLLWKKLHENAMHDRYYAYLNVIGGDLVHLALG